MRSIARVTLLVATLIGLGPVCNAQEPPPESMREELDRLRLRLDELERRQALADAAPVTSDDGTGSDLDDLLGKQHPSTEFGSFGIRLTQYGVDPYLHGYFSESFAATHDFPTARSASGSRISLESSFLLSEFAVIVGANIKDTVIPEVQFAYETGTSGSGVDARAIHLRYGQVDLHLHDLLTIRAGKFLIPFGRYNESLYPDFLFPINRVLLRSFVNIVPVIWADTGIQVRGRYRIVEDLELNYAAYIVNGLRQSDTSKVAGVVADGGSIAAMKANNDLDVGDGSKTYGGRLGIKAWGVDAGLSVVGGAYTPDDRQYLYLTGYYFYFHWQGFSLGSEGVLCRQERAAPNSDLHRRGGFAYMAYRFFEVPVPIVRHSIDIEPVVAIDYTYLDEGQYSTLYMGGLQFYFLPEDLPNAKLSFTGGALESSTRGSMASLLLINLSVAF